jgi:hypothetical protein
MCLGRKIRLYPAAKAASAYEGYTGSKAAMHRTEEAHNSSTRFRKNKRRTETEATRKFLPEPRKRTLWLLSVSLQKVTVPPQE